RSRKRYRGDRSRAFSAARDFARLRGLDCLRGASSRARQPARTVRWLRTGAATAWIARGHRAVRGVHHADASGLGSGKSSIPATIDFAVSAWWNTGADAMVQRPTTGHDLA